MTLPLIFTCGDPAGVGPEIIAGWLARQPDNAPPVAVVGPPRWLAGLSGRFTPVPIGLDEYVASPGHPDPEGALVAWAAMQRAAAGCRQGEFAGVVTGPVSKGQLASIGYPHPGQTEFFAEQWGGEPTMAFCGGRLRVVLATWHIPLAEVPAAITPAAIERAVRAADELARATVEPPPDAGPVLSPPVARRPTRIAVCGLNPHAGERGLLGGEELQVINPVLQTLRNEFPGLTEALPGDTVFGRAFQGEFDVVIALYHDQGLAPLKTVEFDEAVNVTLGLPYVRTSPDHGTAFAIAGKQVARGTSFANAVQVARRLVAARH